MLEIKILISLLGCLLETEIPRCHSKPLRSAPLRPTLPMLRSGDTGVLLGVLRDMEWGGRGEKAKTYYETMFPGTRDANEIVGNVLVNSLHLK